MRRPLPLVLLMIMMLVGMSPARAQQAETPVDEDGSSQQTEQSDDSFRRSRELEDARARDRTYVDNTYTAQSELEKIDKLPEESRDNIRDQLVDIIVEDGEWEPKDALKEYPYEPTAAAESDPELEEQEQEAWDEQIEKYHEREAAAWGSHRGPVPGPGNPSGRPRTWRRSPSGAHRALRGASSRGRSARRRSLARGGRASPRRGAGRPRRSRPHPER